MRVVRKIDRKKAAFRNTASSLRKRLCFHHHYPTCTARPADRPGLERQQSAKNRPKSRERSEEHTSELQSLMRISYAVFCLKKKKTYYKQIQYNEEHSN